MYMLGDLGLAARRAAAVSTRTKTPAPESAETPAAAIGPDEQQPVRRRRQAKSTMLGRGYEYMDLEDEGESVATVAASDRGSGTQGFAGTSTKADAGRAAGLTTLNDGAFGGGPRMPMVPGTWSGKPTPPPDPADGSASHT